MYKVYSLACEMGCFIFVLCIGIFGVKCDSFNVIILILGMKNHQMLVLCVYFTLYQVIMVYYEIRIMVD